MEQPALSQQRVATNGGTSGGVSLVRGGPFYRAQEAVRLIKPDGWNLGRRITVAIAVGWFPLVLITLLFNPGAVLGLLTDYPINARLLVGVPVLLVGQRVMEATFRTMVGQIRECGLLPPPELERMDQVIVNLMRLRDSFIPELVIVGAGYAHVAQGVTSHIALARPWALAGTHLSAAAWYFVLVSQLLYQLLLGISLWKWLLWSVFLFRLSKLDMQLVPTHPDHHGGIGFLGISPLGIAPTIFVVATTVGGTWRVEILRQGAHLMSFKSYAIVLVAIMLIGALGPLVFFVPKLGRLRRKGILQYGILAQLHSTDFHKKWILGRAGHEEEFLTAPDASSVTDYGTTYESIEGMQPFPYDRTAVGALILALVIPMLPVVLAEIPLSEVLKGLLQAVR